MADKNIDKPKFQWNTAKDVDGKIPKHVVEFIESWVLLHEPKCFDSEDIQIIVSKHPRFDGYYYNIKVISEETIWRQFGTIFYVDWQIDSEYLIKSLTNSDTYLKLSRLWKACLLKYSKNSS